MPTSCQISEARVAPTTTPRFDRAVTSPKDRPRRPPSVARVRRANHEDCAAASPPPAAIAVPKITATEACAISDPRWATTRIEPTAIIRRRPDRSAIRLSQGPSRIEPSPNIAKIRVTWLIGMPSSSLANGANVVIQPPNAALKPRFQRASATSGCAAEARAMARARLVAMTIRCWSMTFATAMEGAGEDAGPPADGTSGSAGRNRTAAAPAASAVIPTTTNGMRRSASARTPPITGPVTEPAAPAADRIPLVNARRARSATRATYRRSAMIESPPPNPAIPRNAMRGMALWAVAMRKFAAA